MTEEKQNRLLELIHHLEDVDNVRRLFPKEGE